METSKGSNNPQDPKIHRNYRSKRSTRLKTIQKHWLGYCHLDINFPVISLGSQNPLDYGILGSPDPWIIKFLSKTFKGKNIKFSGPWKQPRLFGQVFHQAKWVWKTPMLSGGIAIA